jgi:hypothetical protein
MAAPDGRNETSSRNNKDDSGAALAHVLKEMLRRERPCRGQGWISR